MNVLEKIKNEEYNQLCLKKATLTNLDALKKNPSTALAVEIIHTTCCIKHSFYKPTQMDCK